ncbi:MAG: YitT family protein [Bacilli bacterium]
MLNNNKDATSILFRINKKYRLKRYFQFVIGLLLVAIAFNLFLEPNNLLAGGVSGIAIIVKHFIGLEPSLVVFGCSCFLLIISYFTLGKAKTLGSLFGTFLFPLFIKLTANIDVIIDIDSTQLLLSAVFGGVLSGLGVGLVFKGGFSTGGTDIVNQIISKYAHVSLGNSMIMSDGLIVLAGVFIFGPTKLMYSLVVLYIISVMSDRVVLGISDSKAFYIITNKEKEVKEYIMKYLNHGVTVLGGKGGFTKEKQDVLMTVVPTKEYFKLKEGIHEIDNEAFFVVTDAYEVFGGE